MSTIIYKYKLEPTRGNQKIELPVNYHILDIQIQKNNICVWIEVNQENPKVIVEFEFYETGKEIPTPVIGRYRRYIKTIQLSHGDYVLHIYIHI